MKKYCAISSEILKSLPKRTRDILIQRFGLFGEKKYTLENIGEKYKVTRERVRQIEKDGIKQARKKTKDFSSEVEILKERIDQFGGIKKENLLIEDIVGKDMDGEGKNCAVFILHLCEDFLRFPGNKNFFTFWAKDEKVAVRAKTIIEDVVQILTKNNKLLNLDKIKKEVTDKDISSKFLTSAIEISKQIEKDDSGLYGLSKWPEINPRGIKDKAYIAFKKANKPLHFREVAVLLGNNTNAQTTHNELIKDSRFVLIGRGVYALAEWGYTPGEVKEVIKKILIKKGALNKNDIIVHVSEQRIVKKNTIIQNLSNKKYFIRTPDGKYTIA